MRSEISRDVKKWNENIQNLQRRSDTKIPKFLVDHSSFYSEPHR